MKKRKAAIFFFVSRPYLSFEQKHIPPSLTENGFQMEIPGSMAVYEANRKRACKSEFENQPK